MSTVSFGDPNLQYTVHRSIRQRAKVQDKARRRIKLACENCRKRKMKCTGEQPCRECSHKNLSCNYPPLSAKIVIPEIYLESLRSRIFALEKCLHDAVPNQSFLDEITSRHGVRLQNTISTPSSTVAASPENIYTLSGAGTVGSGSPDVSHHEFEEFDETFAGQWNLFGSIGPSGPHEISDLTWKPDPIADSAGTTFLDQIATAIKDALPLFSVAGAAGYESVGEENSRFFTFLSQIYHGNDHGPLSVPPEDLYTLPTKPVAWALVEGFLERWGGGTASHPAIGGGIFYWFNPTAFVQLTEQLFVEPTYGSPSIDDTMLCLINSVLAVGAQATGGVKSDGGFDTLPSWRAGSFSTVAGHHPLVYEPSVVQSRPQMPPGISFYARAKMLLSNPVEEATRQRLPVLTLMAFFLLSAYQRHAGYMYIGLAVTLCKAHGLHRSSRNLTTTSPENTPHVAFSPVDASIRSAVDAEERKREFWNVYILDRYYSCLIGRPVMLPDDDIDVDYPSETPGLPSCLGLTAHIKLCKIMGHIVSKLYGIRNTTSAGQPRDSTEVMRITDGILRELSKWKESLPSELTHVDGSDRGRCLLHLLHNQLCILATRSSLLVAVKKTTAAAAYLSLNEVQLPHFVNDHVRSCALASRQNIALLKQTNWVSFHTFTDYHYIFNAVLVLLLLRLLHRRDAVGHDLGEERTAEEDDVNFGIAFLLDLGDKGNETASSCANICVELRNVVQRMLVAQAQRGMVLASANIQTMDDPAYGYAPLTGGLAQQGGGDMYMMSGDQVGDPEGAPGVQPWLQSGVSGM